MIFRGLFFEYNALDWAKRLFKDGHWLRCFNDMPRLNAGGANHYLFDAAFMHRLNSLEVWIEASFCYIMSVADVMTYNGSFTAYFTDFRHDDFSLSIIKPAHLYHQKMKVKCFFNFLILLTIDSCKGQYI